jgi:hypothetical protein
VTDDDQIVAQGRLLNEFAQLTKRLVSLKSEGERMSTILSAFDPELRDQNYGSSSGRQVSVNDEVVTVTYSSSSHLNAKGKWPSLEEVRAMVADITSTKKRLEELTKQLKALGLPLK